MNINKVIIYIESLLEPVESATKPIIDHTKLIRNLTECPCLGYIAIYINWPKTISEFKTLLIDLNYNQIMTKSVQLFQLDVLETRPGKLLKLESKTGIDMLKEAIVSGDALKTSCGH